MIYNIFRLGCIAYSTAVTWNAVASEGPHAKQHAFLWIILFSGLMVEPFIDALSEASYVPWIKIGVVSWIVLAHYTMPTWSHSYHNRPTSETAPTARISPPTSLHSPIENFDTMSERAENLRRLQRVQEIAATPKSHSFSSSNNLDFGRFKRDLERRQRPESPALFREKSANSSMEDHFPHRDRSLKDNALRDAASLYSNPTTVAERFSRPMASSRPSSVMSNSLFEKAHPDQRFSTSVNRPTRTVTTNSILLPDNPFQISQGPAGPAPEFVRKASAASSATATATIVPELTRNSSGSNEYPLKPDDRNRKRPLSALFSDSTDSGRRALVRPRSNHESVRISRPVSRFHDSRTRKKHVSPDTMSESALARKSKRMRETVLSQNEGSTAIDDRNFKVPQERIQSSQPSKESRTQVTNKIPTSPMKSSLMFARPKPPGKHRTRTVEPPMRRLSGSRTYSKDFEHTITREEGGSSSRSDSANNSFEQRMQKVQVWIKDRNPSMLSPPLTSSSETMHRSPTDDDHDYDRPKSQSSGKRKAQHQLRGKDPKRHHQHEEQDSAPSSQPTSTSTATSTRHHQHEGLDPLRDQQDPDTSTLPPVDWSRFQVRPTTPRKPFLVASPRTSSSPYRSRTPAALPKTATPKRLNSSLGSDPSAVAVSPLIRLRQSQLQRRQQEDFWGIKRDSATSNMHRRQDDDEAAATLQFNQVLETWEREDDETLARNAAKEAEALEGRGQNLGDEGGSEGYTMAAPMPSLQRVIPLHGESSRRPVPDFSTKKSSHSPANGTSFGGSAPSLPSFNFRSTMNKSWGAKSSSSSLARTPTSAERRHPGLFTPSKKNAAREQQELVGTETKSPYKTTPTMSRYTQLSLLTDDETS